MRFIHLALVLCLTAPLGILATSTPADAELICRTYYYWSGSRRCWRRTCWRVPDRHYAYRPDPRPYWEDTTKNTRAQRNLLDEVDDTTPSSRRAEWWDNDDDDDNSEETTTPAPKRFAAATPYTPRVDPLPPRLLPHDFFIPSFLALCLFTALVYFARFFRWLNAIDEQRRILRIERKTDSARELRRRLERDAAEADLLIKKYVEAAYRRGTS